jgi:hypothetical protein
MTAKSGILPLYMPIPHPDGYVIVVKRPTMQKWCMIEPNVALVLTYMAIDNVFIQVLPVVL